MQELDNNSKPLVSVADLAEKEIEKKSKIYGNPVGNMIEIANRWSITLRTRVTAEDVVRCLIDLKQARLSGTPDHKDSIVDIAGYAIILDKLRDRSRPGVLVKDDTSPNRPSYEGERLEGLRHNDRTRR